LELEPEPELEPLDEDDVPEPSPFFGGADFVSAVVESPPDEPARSVEVALSDPSVAPAPSFERAVARALEPRSFFAQPLPLK